MRQVPLPAHQAEGALPALPLGQIRSLLRVEAGGQDIDAFVHAGGRVCDRARRAEPGTRVGLNGPDGGAVPRGKHLLIGKGKTTCPALAHMLAESPANMRGQCWLFGDSDDYDRPDHRGMARIHAPRAGAGLVAQLTRQEYAATPSLSDQ
ncbi:ferredoxin reductase domain-containing protein [Paracoccus jiaweipingae]|uniref:hypothetical protein n=1 Tax=unclassified Paracoccus (in: a-proteobacteria) TaxID=2688777 RepID=UPI0037906709